MLTASELAGMQAAQAGAMLDRCRVLTPTAATGEFGQEGAVYEEGAEVACGFEAGTASRGGSLAGVMVVLNARLRLGLVDGATVTPDVLIQVTARAGAVLNPAEFYRVAGWPRRGATCVVVEVERVAAPAG